MSDKILVIINKINENSIHLKKNVLIAFEKKVIVFLFNCYLYDRYFIPV